MGAWIETDFVESTFVQGQVAPCVGAWIETKPRRSYSGRAKSHPVWVRGLKQQEGQARINANAVAPCVGAWIETPSWQASLWAKSSHPVWVRGLKQLCPHRAACPVRSHPVWVRGLKLTASIQVYIKQKSHPVWVRGLKLAHIAHKNICKSRTLCGCVD